MSVLQQVLKKASWQRPLPDQKAFNLSDSSIFPSLFASLSGWRNAFLSTAALVLQYVFEPSQPTKTSIRPEDLSVLWYWGVTLLRLLMFLRSSERSLNNQPKRRTLRLKSGYRWVTYNDWRVQTQALLPTSSPGMEGWTRLLWHSVGRNCVGWFNLAAATRVESKKPTGFILLARGIEFTKPVFPAMCKTFCDTHQVYQAYFFYGYTEPNKTACPVIYLEPTAHNELG